MLKQTIMKVANSGEREKRNKNIFNNLEDTEKLRPEHQAPLKVPFLSVRQKEKF